MPRVAIFDYGAGNIFSLKNALERNGAEVKVIDNLEHVDNISGLLLPGVGNFDPAMRSIREGLDNSSKAVLDGSIPILGICLGMEMYFERSQEGKEPGLGTISGEVISLPDTIKVPHMGWNNLDVCGNSKLLEGINEDKIWAYFVHSYQVLPKDSQIITATADYGTQIPATIEYNSLYGTQFHPEKSGRVGGLMLANFLRECQK